MIYKLLALLLLVRTPPSGDADDSLGADARFQRRLAMDRDSPFHHLEWQPIGPRFCGGRIESIAVVERDPETWYVAPGSGNLFRSDDGGRNWTAQFEHEVTGAIGDVFVDPSAPETVWIGTGEAHLGGYSYDGAGVFRSTDGGQSWEHRGLAEVARIGKVRVHPKHSNVVWVAAIGRHIGGSGDSAGLYRSEDAGESWERTLDPGEGVAVIDLVVDALVPDRLFCTTWERGRGTGSGVHRSRDGGRSWERLGEDRGLPVNEELERVAVDLCHSQSEIAYALYVDGSKPGGGRYGVGGVVFRSDDGGDSWHRTHEDFLPTYVGWDFCDIKIAPADSNTVYVCGMKLLRSRDGGKTWQEAGESIERRIPFQTVEFETDGILHLDMHDLWLDPLRPGRLLLGTDGGLFESTDAGAHWRHHNTLPIAEFYTVYADDNSPYRIYGGTQDNASVTGTRASLADRSGNDEPGDWQHVFLDRWAGGDGFVTLPDPMDPSLIYFEHQNGDLRRKRRDGSTLSGAADVRIRPPGRELRFAWNTPLVVSVHGQEVLPAPTLYCASQHVHRSFDRGTSWQRIGEDLGGGRPLTTLTESPRVAGLLATGSSSGTVQVAVSRGSSHPTAPEADDEFENHGVRWREASALPPGKLERLVLSQHRNPRLYACMSAPGGGGKLLRSDDLGTRWQDLSSGLPHEAAYVVAEDPRDPELLYLGTRAGVCISTDGGQSWESLSTTLPTVPVLDLYLQVRELDLLAATHGRSLYVLDVESLGSGHGERR